MSEREAFVHFLQGDMDAVRFCEAVFKVSQIWDDLIDQDAAMPKSRIDDAFWTCLIEIPRNPFYRAHADFLQPLLQASIMDWLDSRHFETGSEHEKEVAFVLRDSISALVIHCAGLVGGKDWMLSVSPVIRRLIFDETLGDYKAGL